MPLTDYRCPFCHGHVHTDGLLDGEHALGCGEDIARFHVDGDWILPTDDEIVEREQHTVEGL